MGCSRPGWRPETSTDADGVWVFDGVCNFCSGSVRLALALERSDAVIALVRRLPAPWRWLAAARVVPKARRDAGYDWIARNRYRLMGKRRECMIPSPEVRAGFILERP